ncbi:hypothetical protein EON73_01665 [bacterium]|nr:MAG: hypothetical protein EON73_01665 [bacterium]
MEQVAINSRSVKKLTYDFEFSICTLVTRETEYQEMLQTFLDKGFSTKDCEYLYIDNTTDCTFEAFEGLNHFLQQARGKYIIICHQDILLTDDDRNQLAKCIQEVDQVDSAWAILANAGGINFKWIATHLTQKSGKKITEKRLPLLTKTVDENFIVVKNDSNLALSHNLKGFHLYGTDICLIADILGYNSYIINFNLLHKSNGNADKHFYATKKALMNKYRKAFRSRFLATTITRFFISGSFTLQTVINIPSILFFVRQYYKHVWHKKHYVPKHKKTE